MVTEDKTQYHVTFKYPVRVKLSGVSTMVYAIDATLGEHTGTEQSLHPHTLYLHAKTVRFTGTISVPYDNIAGRIAQAFTVGK